jgi:hypothetical protein
MNGYWIIISYMVKTPSGPWPLGMIFSSRCFETQGEFSTFIEHCQLQLVTGSLLSPCGRHDFYTL